MKKNVLRFLKILCLMLAFALTAGVLQQLVLVHADHNRQRINGFYEEKENSLDIVLLGASEVYSDFAPAHAWPAVSQRGGKSLQDALTRLELTKKGLKVRRN